VEAQGEYCCLITQAEIRPEGNMVMVKQGPKLSLYMQRLSWEAFVVFCEKQGRMFSQDYFLRLGCK
jgi:hypothetical protein